jgi:hypothetical protein
MPTSSSGSDTASVDAEPADRVHPERIVALAHEGAWADAWRMVHRALPALDGDERLSWAASTLADAFFQRLGADEAAREETHGDDQPLPDNVADALETVVLLHSGGLYPLTDARFRRAVTALVRWHRAEGASEAARQYARLCPDADVCQAVLRDEEPDSEPEASDAGGEMPAPTRERLDTDPERPLTASVIRPASSADHTQGLFRSDLEATFFQAVRAAFPSYVPYPNVALQSLVDVDALRPHLDEEAQAYLFRALVDCVVCDQHAGYRPVYAFELDSQHHDAPDRQHRDGLKDRICAAAGLPLYRIRQTGGLAETDDFVHLLRTIAESA